MNLFPLMTSLIATIVIFAGVTYVLQCYRRRFEQPEIMSTFVIAIATFLFVITMFYGEQLLKGKAGEAIVGIVMVLIVLSASTVVDKVLRKKEPAAGDPQISG